MKKVKIEENGFNTLDAFILIVMSIFAIIALSAVLNLTRSIGEEYAYLSYNTKEEVQNDKDKDQLIFDNGVLNFVNSDGDEFAFHSPRDARNGAGSQKEIYDRTVTPIEQYLILHPNILSEDIDIIVGNGERDMEVPASIENEYEKFEEMLEDNLSQLIADGHLVDNPLIKKSQYQFHSKNGEWELVGYDGETVDFKKMKDQSANKIKLEELVKYADEIEK